MIRVMGIDPGTTGGCAAIIADAGETLLVKFVHFAGKTDTEIVRELTGAIGVWPYDKVVCERVGVRPGQGRSSNAKLVCNHAAVLACLATLNIDVEHVEAQKWRKFYALGPQEKYTARKKANWKRALEFVDNITADEADAYLIARRAWAHEKTKGV